MIGIQDRMFFNIDQAAIELHHVFYHDSTITYFYVRKLLRLPLICSSLFENDYAIWGHHTIKTHYNHIEALNIQDQIRSMD